jgi:hypothetical protein
VRYNQLITFLYATEDTKHKEATYLPANKTPRKFEQLISKYVAVPEPLATMEADRKALYVG